MEWNERVDGTCTWLFGRFSVFMGFIPPNQSINQKTNQNSNAMTPKHNPFKFGYQNTIQSFNGP